MIEGIDLIYVKSKGLNSCSTQHIAMKREIDIFIDYLKLRYSERTIYIYSWAYTKYAPRLESQQHINDFVIEVITKHNRNPLYMGFLKAYIDCFQLPFTIPKSKKKIIKQDKKYKFITKEQVDRIIRELPDYYSLITRLFWETGLRLRELINAHYNDIDIENRVIEGKGKYNKPFSVKFSKQTAVFLQRWLDWCYENDWEYPFHDPDKPRIKDHARAYYYYLRTFCRDVLGIENIHPHRLRHAIGYHLRHDKGFDLQQIRVKLRHAKLETTGIYSVATQEEVDKKIDEEVFS